MEVKKNPEVDPDNKKGFLFTIGVLSALGLVLVAFEFSQFESGPSDLGKLSVELEEEEMIPITQQEPPPPPPPPPPQTTIIEIVEDDEEIEEELEIEDTDIDEDTEIEPMIMEEEESEEPEIFTIVEDMPSFPGGEGELFRYLGENIKYPPMAKDAGITGTVFVTFVVKEDGKVSGSRVLRGIGGGCDEEAIRVVQSMPAWKPGKQRGKAVRVQYNLPIRFVLR